MEAGGAWKEEFLKVASNPNSEFHFDLTDFTESGQINFQELSATISNPVTSSQWEFEKLYFEFPSKFSKTTFYFGGEEYVGKEVFNIGEKK